MTCPLCRRESRIWVEQHGFEIHDCTSCGHRFAPMAWSADQHVDEVYGDQYFRGGGAGYADYLAESSTLVERGERFAKLIGKVGGQRGRMLDIGAAAGYLMQGWKNQGWEVVGVEPNEGMAKFARDQLHLTSHCGSFESMDLTSIGLFDCIAMVQVLPHLFDPAAAIARASQLLRPGGFLLIETWNYRSLVARMFGKSWHEYSPPSVLHWFSIRSLKALGMATPLHFVSHGKTIRWISAKHAKSLLQFLGKRSWLGKTAAVSASMIPDGWQIPYPGDDLFWMVFRKHDSH